MTSVAVDEPFQVARDGFGHTAFPEQNIVLFRNPIAFAGINQFAEKNLSHAVDFFS